MLTIRRGVVSSASVKRPGLIELEAIVDGSPRRALAYEAHTGPVAEGDTVLLNTSAVDLALGTGGYDFVIAVEGATASPTLPGHAMKLRYTAMQTVVSPVEETHRDAFDAFTGLDGMRVVLCGLHSMLPAAALGARLAQPGARMVYVMSDAAALPLAFSDTVAAMRDTGLLDATITCGNAFGGDHEAVTAYAGLAAARGVARADVVVAGMGPGNLGTASALGTTFLDQAALANAVTALGGEAVVVPRLSTRDERDRHRGVSHHTRTVAELILGAWTLVVPAMTDEERALVEPALAGLKGRRVDVHDRRLDDALAASPVALRTMGRSAADDPLPFRAAAAAGFYAATGK